MKKARSSVLWDEAMKIVNDIEKKLDKKGVADLKQMIDKLDHYFISKALSMRTMSVPNTAIWDEAIKIEDKLEKKLDKNERGLLFYLIRKLDDYHAEKNNEAIIALYNVKWTGKSY